MMGTNSPPPREILLQLCRDGRELADSVKNNFHPERIEALCDPYP